MADGKAAGIEASAISVLKRAVELDNHRRFEEALTCYQEGVALLMQVLKTLTDASKKQTYRQKIEEYLARAEELKLFVKEEKEAYKHKQVQVEDGSTGHTYEKLFGHCFTHHVTAIEVEDPYIRNPFQIMNFLRLCELVVKKKAPVKIIKLITGKDEKSPQDQHQSLMNICRSLESVGIRLEIEYSNTLHDREIRLNSGWVIKIGRGLDIYKPCDKFSIGSLEMELRPCRETTVDIFHRKNVGGSSTK